MPFGLNPAKAAAAVVWASVVLLVFSAASKLVSAVGSARILLEQDPVFGMTNRQLFFLLGFLELAVVFTIVRTPNLKLKLLLLAGLSTNMLLYQAGILWLGLPRPCPCLGNAGAWLRLSPGFVSSVIKGWLAWLLCTSYGSLFLVSQGTNLPPIQEPPIESAGTAPD
jgi:hypothetical protein